MPPPIQKNPATPPSSHVPSTPAPSKPKTNTTKKGSFNAQSNFFNEPFRNKINNRSNVILCYFGPFETPPKYPDESCYAEEMKKLENPKLTPNELRTIYDKVETCIKQEEAQQNAVETAPIQQTVTPSAPPKKSSKPAEESETPSSFSNKRPLAFFMKKIATIIS